MENLSQQRPLLGSAQDAVEACAALVCGRGWTGIIAVWVLTQLGVRAIRWMGKAPGVGKSMVKMLRERADSEEVQVFEFRFDPDTLDEMKLALVDGPIQLVVDCTDGRWAPPLLREFAERCGAICLEGSADTCGWAESGELSRCMSEVPSPLDFIRAALLADNLRAALGPGGSEVLSLSRLGLITPVPPPLCVTQVGVGGIGVYSATIMAALGADLEIVDFDHVEHSNLRRQGLYSVDDARHRRPKATAAREALCRLFEGTQVRAVVDEVDESFHDHLSRRRPDVVVSAVDNAAARIALQHICRDLGIPLVTGGTDLFVAQAVTQLPEGPTLDEQLHGAVSAALADEEDAARRGVCLVEPAYVVPSVICGALVAHRVCQVANGETDLPIFRWRSGVLPRELRRGHSNVQATPRGR